MNLIESWIKERGKLHFTLIDPDKQSPEKAGELASRVESWGSDAIMVGGSTIVGDPVDATCKAIKKEAKIPVILFPSSARAVSGYADYIFFMSCLNSTRRKLIIGEQVRGALLVEKLGITPISMGYILINTGKTTTVEKVAKPDVIRENDVEKAMAYALTTQYLGMDCVYLEAGSGAEKPVPVQMIVEIRKKLSIPIILGGGIRTRDLVKERIDAGADIIVTGTIAERNRDVAKEIIETVKNAGH